MNKTESHRSRSFSRDQSEPSGLYQKWADRLVDMLAEQSQRSIQAHSQFLRSRLDNIFNLGQLTRKQLVGIPPANFSQPPLSPDLKPLFIEAQLREFSEGSIAACLGPEYQIYEHRRAPRIPNGDLQLISRVLNIQGQRFDFKNGAQISTQYDVPTSAWFLSLNDPTDIPFAVLMEIALQPCGFLSGYLGTSLVDPHMDWYFRNLDGTAHLLKTMDLRGKTITSHAHLVRTTLSPTIILQNFTFELEADEQVFYRGEAVFGYFSLETMRNQVGLDSGSATAPWYLRANLASFPLNHTKLTRSSPHLNTIPGESQHLKDFSEVILVPQGGKYQQGYVYACKEIQPQDWYFSCHFYQDPVMPGSLGVQAIIEALKVYMRHHKPVENFKLRTPHELPLTWKYRGQILPKNKTLELEVHITRVESRPDRLTAFIEANLWSDRMRIYEIKGAALDLITG